METLIRAIRTGAIMKYRLIAFDFDGTLADSFPWFLRTVNSAADKYQFKRIESDQVDSLRSTGPRQIMAQLGLPLWRLPLVTRYMTRLMAESLDEVTLFDGVDRVLMALSSNGIDSAILTSNSYENVCHILGEKNTAFVRYFECSAALFGKGAKLRKLLKLSGVKPDEALYIGDEIRDAEAARAEGIDFVGVSWGYTRAEFLQTFSSRTLLESLDDVIKVAV
jgi:phosphoglycolate phosphatase